jgi:hypothetical protein
MIEME